MTLLLSMRNAYHSSSGGFCARLLRKYRKLKYNVLLSLMMIAFHRRIEFKRGAPGGHSLVPAGMHTCGGWGWGRTLWARPVYSAALLSDRWWWRSGVGSARRRRWARRRRAARPPPARAAPATYRDPHIHRSTRARTRLLDCSI